MNRYGGDSGLLEIRHRRLSLGSALSELVRLAPQKYDPNVVQSLLIQIRRGAVGSSRAPLLADRMADHMAATLQHKVSRAER